MCAPLSPRHTRLTTRLRPTCDRKMLQSWANRRKNVILVAEVVGDRQGKISRSKVVVMFKTQSHRATTRLRPTCHRKMLQSWANRRNNVRLVAEVVRLVAEVVGDRKGQICRNKVDGHVQNLKHAIVNRKRSHD